MARGFAEPKNPQDWNPAILEPAAGFCMRTHAHPYIGVSENGVSPHMAI